MTRDGPDPERTVHLEVFGALDTDALALVIRLAHSTIRSGCAEVVLQMQALTDFPTRLFAELHQLDRAARAHHCALRLLGLNEAVAAVVQTGPRADHRPTSPSVDATAAFSLTCTTGRH
jgi:hypothetical protein